jgi:hypothetical protein
LVPRTQDLTETGGEYEWPRKVIVRTAGRSRPGDEEELS